MNILTALYATFKLLFPALICNWVSKFKPKFQTQPLMNPPQWLALKRDEGHNCTNK